MPRKKSFQTNFSAGELAPELISRQDTEQYANGAKSLLNYQCLIGGGARRRPGLAWLANLPFDSILVEFIVNQTTRYILAFSAGRMDAFLEDGTAAGNLTAKPWTGTIWREMDWAQAGNTIFLVHPDMPPQRVIRTGAATWLSGPFEFFRGPGSTTEQPYYRVANPAYTLAPSALSGPGITLQATVGSNVFVGAHVGSIFRYVGKEVLITAVADGDTAVGNVIETLPSTQSLTVTSSAQFAVGEAVAGQVSNARGTITAIPDGVHVEVVVTTGLTEFEVEDLVGPNGVTSISAVAAATPAAVVDWDEQLFSVVNGYPACIELHRNRLLFAGHPAVPNALIASRINNLYSFNVDDGTDADAIFETIGDAGASAIVQLYSAEQLLVLTDHGPYYVPESQANPFRPTSIAFFPFGSPWPITASAKARPFDGGVLAVSGSLVIKLKPTGDLTRSWDAEEVSLLSSHIIHSPVGLAVASNFAGGAERYAFLLNDDGTIAVLQLVEQQKIRNVTPWETSGSVKSICCIQGDAFAVVQRFVAGATHYYLEKFDTSYTLDLARTVAAITDIAPFYGTTSVNVIAGGYSLGPTPLAFGTPPAGPYEVGLFYDTELEILPPAVDDREGSHAGELMRILESYVQVQDSARFAQNGYELSAYQVTDALDEAPPNRSGFQRFQFQGWSREPTLTITQPDPLSLTVLGIKTIVAF